MAEYDNNNRGSAWVNDKKTTDKHPDYTGSITVNGVEYWLSMWDKKPDAKPKAPLFRISIQEKGEAKPKAAAPVRAPAPQRAEMPAGFDDFEDDIPF